MIRVLLVEDYAVFREPLAEALSAEPGLAVVGQAGTAAEGVACLRRAAVDVAVVDFHLPDGDALALVRELQGLQPGAEALVLTATPSRRDLARAVEAGAAGAFPKSAPLAELVAAIRRLGDGEPLVAPAEAVALLREAARERERERAAREALGRLTLREREVLAVLADGLSDQEIAERLRVSKETVRTHMVNLLGKLGAESRLQAVVLAARHDAVARGRDVRCTPPPPTRSREPALQVLPSR